MEELVSFIEVSVPSNKMEGTFVLYAVDESEIRSSITVSIRNNKDLEASLSVRRTKHNDLSSTINVMYRGNGDLGSTIDIISVNQLNSTIYVREHNRMFGTFELLDAPRITTQLNPVGDSSTRSRSDLQTINYGNSTRMMIGSDSSETFESFIDFGDINTRIPDIRNIESAKLRLYYTGTISEGEKIELHAPHTRWYEMGITYANKPYSIELLANEYTLNTGQRYIEFDVLDVANRWHRKTLENFGLIVKSSENRQIQFFTRETSRKPILEIKYVSGAVYSLGRSTLDATLFVYGVRDSDMDATILVNSDVGFDWKDSTIYIHRPEVPINVDLNSTIVITRPELDSELTVARRESEIMNTHLIIRVNSVEDAEVHLSVTKPELISSLTVDPNMTLDSFILIASNQESAIESTLTVSKPELNSYLTVSKYHQTEEDVDAELLVRNRQEENLEASISINKGTVPSTIVIAKRDNSDLEARIDVPSYDYVESKFAVSRPELPSTILVKHFDEQESFIEVKERIYLDATIMIRAVEQLDSTIMVKQINEQEASIVVSKPELGSILYPRVIGDEDFEIQISVRQLSANDLDSTIIIKGVGGAYYFIL